jgi:ADP-ribosylation factor-like protein 3
MSILKSLWKFKRTEKECRILLLGLDNAGKTSITRRICDLINDIAYLAPTQGFAIKSLVLNGLSMKIWDIGGTNIAKVTLKYFKFFL